MVVVVAAVVVAGVVAVVLLASVVGICRSKSYCGRSGSIDGLIDGCSIDGYMHVWIDCVAAWSGYRTALLFPRASCVGGRFRVNGAMAGAMPRIVVPPPFPQRNRHVSGPRYRYAAPGGISVQVSQSNQSKQSVTSVKLLIGNQVVHSKLSGKSVTQKNGVSNRSFTSVRQINQSKRSNQSVSQN